MGRPRGHYASLLQEFSVPLLAGVAVALLVANTYPHLYHEILEWEPIRGFQVFGYPVTFHFLVDDIFMVFFFAIAAKEITEAALPGGLLNPISKAVSPLIATLGGVLGPVAIFFLCIAFSFENGIYSANSTTEDNSPADGGSQRRRTSRWRGSSPGRSSGRATRRSCSCCCWPWWTTRSAW